MGYLLFADNEPPILANLILTLAFYVSPSDLTSFFTEGGHARVTRFNSCAMQDYYFTLAALVAYLKGRMAYRPAKNSGTGWEQEDFLYTAKTVVP
jgi:hypothetical protein